VDVTSYAKYALLGERLRALGLAEDTTPVLIMTRGHIASTLVVSVVAVVNLAGCGQSNPTVPVEKARPAATNPNTTTRDPDGTAHITRVIPLPASVSSEARALLSTGESWCPQEGTKAQLALIEQARAMYPVTIEERTIGGVQTKIVSPVTRVPRDRDRVLINLHGGGFVEDSGSTLESIPIAALTGIPVITVYYRLLPKHPWPAQVDVPSLCIGSWSRPTIR
jgi:epsilon-lactone hydrolase